MNPIWLALIIPASIAFGFVFSWYVLIHVCHALTYHPKEDKE